MRRARLFKSAPIIVAILLSVSAINSCSNGVVYNSGQRIPGQVWNRFYVPLFEVEIDDTTTLNNLYINVRNSGEYPRSNLFLFISVTSPQGMYMRDTIEIVLADETGKWRGSGYGSIWQNKVLYRNNIRFAETGVYKFEIEQAMRIDDLPGIVDVGLRVERK